MGREVEFYSRVLNNDPTNAVLVLVVLANAGLEEDATLKQYTTLAAVLAASNNEVTNAYYSRLVLDQTDLDPISIDVGFGRTTLPFQQQTFPTIGVGDAWRKLLVCYDSDSTTGADSAIIPITYHDILLDGVALVPNGGNIYVAGPTGFAVAS
jgi:hypothetical protein